MVVNAVVVVVVEVVGVCVGVVLHVGGDVVGRYATTTTATAATITITTAIIAMTATAIATVDRHDGPITTTTIPAGHGVHVVQRHRKAFHGRRQRPSQSAALPAGGPSTGPSTRRRRGRPAVGGLSTGRRR